jgi:hypothetical protein
VTLSCAEVVDAQEMRRGKSSTRQGRNKGGLMKLFTTIFKKKRLTLATLLLSFAAAICDVPQRLDLYDDAGNLLMFVTFEYEGGKNVSRTVYMSDSTFVRKVFITYDLQGRRARESSLNFNDDTSFISTYDYRGDTTGFSIADMFGMDQLGGKVRYRTNDSTHFSFSYSAQGSSVTYTISYVKNLDGNPTKVTVSDNKGESHFGIFIYANTGVKISRSMAKGPLVSVRVRSARIIDVGVDLKKPALVKCDLISLSGRRAGALFEGLLAPGAQHKSLRVGSLAQGVYMVTISIDGVMVTKTKYVYQHSSLGGAQ